MKRKTKIWGVFTPLMLAAAVVLGLVACSETYVGITEEAEVLDVASSGEVAEDYTINGTTYLVSGFGDLTSLTNNDTSWTWWDGATDYVSVSGNFCLVFWWTQSADDYADNTLEVIADGDYWDWSVASAPSSAWGNWITNYTQQWSYVEGDSILGNWQVVVLRYDTTLAVLATNGDYTYYMTQSGFTTSDCSIGFTGNPAAGIDDGTLYYMLGTVTGTQAGGESKTKVATYNGGRTSNIFSSVTVSYFTELTSSGMTGTAGSVVYTLASDSSTEYTVGAVNNEATYTDEESGITYTIILSYSKGNWTYVYSATQDYIASGNSLSETVTVNITIADDGTETVNSVTVGSTSCTGSDTSWSYDSFDVSSASFGEEVITVSGTTTTISVSLSGSAANGYSYTGTSSTSNKNLEITRMSVTSTDSASTDCFIWSYKVAADTAGYTPFLAGEDNIYYINGYSYGSISKDLSSSPIEVDSSTGWFAGLYAVGASAQSSNSSYSTVITDDGAVTISSDNSPISVWGTSARAGSTSGDYWEGVCLFLASSSTEALAIRMDSAGWDDWYNSDNLTLYEYNCSMDSTDSSILDSCVWCYTITYNTSETIITCEVYDVSSSE